jgi:hypothetical protein
MSSFHCTLTLDGHDLPVVHCVYEFNQATNQRGQAQTKVRNGRITVHLDVPDSDQLVAWAADPHKKLNGHLIFHETNSPVGREKLVFEDAFCVSYQEVFRSGTDKEGSYRCMLQISAAKLTLGTAEKDGNWSQTR